MLQLARAHQMRGEYRRAADALRAGRGRAPGDRHGRSASSAWPDISLYRGSTHPGLGVWPSSATSTRRSFRGPKAIRVGAEHSAIRQHTDRLAEYAWRRATSSAATSRRSGASLEHSVDPALVSLSVPASWPLTSSAARRTYSLAGQDARAIPLLGEGRAAGRRPDTDRREPHIVGDVARRGVPRGRPSRRREATRSLTRCARAGAQPEGARLPAYALRAARRDRVAAQRPARPSRRPSAATARRWPWPRSWRCARSRPAATSASASCCRRVGRQDEAHAELTAAVTMLREMGMTYWLPEAEAALGARSS